MSVQIALLEPATRVASRKLGPVASGAGVLAERGASLGDEQVGQHVRKMGDGRHQAVVALGVDRDRLGAELANQPLEGGMGSGRGGQIPNGAVEQVRARVLDA